MANIESKNTVRVEDQKLDKRTYIEGDPSGSPRILIMGNSITRHPPLASIGWNNDCGMAASSKEKDYAHIIISDVKKRYPNAAFCILQAAIWEQEFPNNNPADYFAAARDFRADFIICAITANIKPNKFDSDACVRELFRLHDYIAGDKQVRVIQTTAFFGHEGKSEAVRRYIAERGGDVVEISDLCRDEENLAIGKFEHPGIQHHPGDLGMQRIAERILEKLNKYI